MLELDLDVPHIIIIVRSKGFIQESGLGVGAQGEEEWGHATPIQWIALPLAVTELRDWKFMICKLHKP